ncbi:MAG: cyclic pyranopterin monophosphate synthase MoaC [Actinomycetia bacterium]|jgi:cyclic pyranopterin phosphate synthase|nr:cyclic pyranopterin monophosphate synthase MoaC [Actinomycetes bacterium]
MDELTHLDAEGHARMVDVAERAVTTRTATASGRVTTTAAGRIAAGDVPKGDVVAVARVAGIMATKRTPDLVPLCHPIAVHGVEVEVIVVPEACEVRLRATVRTADRTGVEMEALTAVAVAGLTVIDMVKAVDPHAALRDVLVEAKDGGRSGSWTR